MTGYVLFHFLQSSNNCRLFWCFRSPRLQFGHQFFWFLINFQLRWVFLAACRLSLAAAGRGYSLVGIHGLITAVAPLVAEHRLSIVGSVLATAGGLSYSVSCGIFSDQGRLAGRFLTTGPPGKSWSFVLLVNKYCFHNVLGTHVALG